jgi:membrane protein implicated in regulation of membrane protease activity
MEAEAATSAFEIGPWWWIAAAILLAAAEMLTASTVLIWSALAALVTAIVVWIWPGQGLAAQVAFFAIVSIACVLIGRTMIGRFGNRGDAAATLNRRSAALVGREAEVIAFTFHEGQVSVDGVPWPARLDSTTQRTPKPGDRVRITGADGVVVWVKGL